MAHKKCACGHSFRKTVAETARDVGRSEQSAMKPAHSESRRRTREKPKFYDASQYVREPRKRKPRVSDSDVSRARLEVKHMSPSAAISSSSSSSQSSSLSSAAALAAKLSRGKLHYLSGTSSSSALLATSSSAYKDGATDAEGGDAEPVVVPEDILADATKDEMRKYGVILSSINHKLAMVNPMFS